MTEGLKKEQKEALLLKYPTPSNFGAAVAPIINSKKLIEEINDAAKIAAELYHTDTGSRKFFALANGAFHMKRAGKKK